MLVIIARLLLAIVLGTLLAIGGYFVGWFVAFSLPEGYPRMAFLVIPTGLASGIGSFLGWWLDVDGSDRSRMRTIAALVLAMAFALGGAWGGLWYGEDVEGTRVWRHPTTQAILNGTVIASNVALLVWHLALKITARRPEVAEPAPSMFETLRTTRSGAPEAKDPD